MYRYFLANKIFSSQLMHFFDKLSLFFLTLPLPRKKLYHIYWKKEKFYDENSFIMPKSKITNQRSLTSSSLNEVR